MCVALASGTLAGLVWFGLQYFTVLPLIQVAESYESDAGGHRHDDEEWRPADGWQRNSLTAAGDVLTGVGFSALLFGFISLTGRSIDAIRGAFWGLAAFACFSLAPALGLPPRPPGVAEAALGDRQLWWVATAIATAVGLYLLFQVPRSWLAKGLGIACLIAPHAVRPPLAAGQSVVPDWLIREFATASVAATGLFWLTLGLFGGFIYNRFRLAQ
jgi:cobalt transporter subunit CbtA